MTALTGTGALYSPYVGSPEASKCFWPKGRNCQSLLAGVGKPAPAPYRASLYMVRGRQEKTDLSRSSRRAQLIHYQMRCIMKAIGQWFYDLLRTLFGYAFGMGVGMAIYAGAAALGDLIRSLLP